MISLAHISKESFKNYEACFIEDYSQELTKNYGISIEKAIIQAKTELGESFPGQQGSLGNYLLCIELQDQGAHHTIGYVWYSSEPESSEAFICDFFVYEEFRCQGYGQIAFKLLEKLLLSNAVNQIKLRVAYSNTRALRLYKEMGFDITGLNMIKHL